MGVCAFNSEAIYERLSALQQLFGAVPSPFDCWLAQRGLKTLHLRMEAASKNALAVARDLQSSPHVLEVFYPGLESHPRRDVVLKQHRDGLGGGVLSFRIRGGAWAAERFCRNTKIFALAVSLGGVESLVELPSFMTHTHMSEAESLQAGVTDDLIRISCGVEHVDELRQDVFQALEKATFDYSSRL